MEIDVIVRDVREDMPNHHVVVSCDTELGRQEAILITVGAYDVVVYPEELKSAIDRVNLSRICR